MVTGTQAGQAEGHTAINEYETLLKIAQLIASNPNMKRTTAIKRVGITNPSVVRRLLDKYQEQEHILLVEVAAANSKLKHEAPAKADAGKKTKTGQPAGASSPAPRSTATQGITEETIVAGGQQAKPNGGAKDATVDPLTAILDGLSIETLVSQFIGHVLGIDAKDIENSPITAMICQRRSSRQ